MVLYVGAVDVSTVTIIFADFWSISFSVDLSYSTQSHISNNPSRRGVLYQMHMINRNVLISLNYGIGNGDLACWYSSLHEIILHGDFHLRISIQQNIVILL